MAKLSGFPELLPADRAVEVAVVDALRRVFELHGFANVETRAVEPVETLLRKGEIDKEVYVVRRIHDDASGDSGSRSDALALHFDLTVPFARYVVENAGKLAFPFRRYQVQKVWRGERPQQGRFREFTQADIDIVGDGTLPFHADVEVARVMAEALAAVSAVLGAGPDDPSWFTLQVSNRKVLEGFYRGLGVAEPTAVMQVVDKLDKLPGERILELLAETGLDETSARACLALAEISTDDTSFVERVRELGVEHPLLDEGLDELATVVAACADVEGVRVTADLRIARGLDYYTGTVFETRMTGQEQLGSVCSGGRYDQLASDGRRTYPGVGISLGLSRLLVPLVANGLTSSRPVPSAVLVAVTDEESRPASDALAQRLRRRGIPTEVSSAAQKFGKQIRTAERRGIPYVLFPGEPPRVGPSVKDIRTGDQVDVDPDTWTPPAADLTPTVAGLGPHSKETTP
ncbi:histidyl-tRNA synthetase [Aeromicrobium sp. SORGH_AS981]|uniref:histidine--tRNA ligase n=1 Tax=Aeromicrobium sp. SORGH_AS_0981 TaxID=3041802 RepID=UPI00285D004F|nr:histidine--tRNA ligase [Aeromicrobium sp. SORGH_AS_0981]MDR6119341.1 histidyl-tRNA synthetase [Aeromicrobium sp. SORGH_AS_0981]